MAFITQTYDPGKVIITFGPYVVGGYADGTFVKVSRNEDSFKLYVGADGTPARARSRNKSGTVEITLAQTSLSNDALSAALAADELLGAGAYPLTVKDLSGTTLVLAPEAWIRKPADLEDGKEVGSRSWTLEMGRLEMFVGGSVV